MNILQTESLDLCAHYKYRSDAVAETRPVIQTMFAKTRSLTMGNAVRAAHPSIARTTDSKPTQNRI